MSHRWGNRLIGGSIDGSVAGSSWVGSVQWAIGGSLLVTKLCLVQCGGSPVGSMMDSLVAKGPNVSQDSSIPCVLQYVSIKHGSSVMYQVSCIKYVMYLVLMYEVLCNKCVTNLLCNYIAI